MDIEDMYNIGDVEPPLAPDLDSTIKFIDPELVDDEVGVQSTYSKSLFDKISINPSDLTKQKLKIWFSMMPAITVDLIHHFEGSSEFFLIHAESLISRVVLDPDYGLNFLSKPQTLRMVFIIENILHTLQTCRAIYRLVFFDSLLPLMKKISPALYTARQLFLLLCQLAQQVEFKVFTHWTDESFKAYCTSPVPFFILLDDMQDIEDKLIQLPQVDVDNESSETTEPMNNPLSLFEATLAMIGTLLTYKIHTTFLRDLEQRGFFLHTFAFKEFNQPELVLKMLNEANEQILKQYKQYQVSQTYNEKTSFDRVTQDWNHFCSIVGPNAPESVNFRDLMIALFLRNENTNELSAEDLSDFLLYVKAYLRLSQLMKVLPLSKRILSGYEDTSASEDKHKTPKSWKYSEMLESLAPYFICEIHNILDIFVTPAGNDFLLSTFTDKNLLLQGIADIYDAKLFENMFITECILLEENPSKITRTCRSDKFLWGDVTENLCVENPKHFEKLLEHLGDCKNVKKYQISLSVFSDTFLETIPKGANTLQPRTHSSTNEFTLLRVEHPFSSQLTDLCSNQKYIKKNSMTDNEVHLPYIQEFLRKYKRIVGCRANFFETKKAAANGRQEYDRMIRNVRNLTQEQLKRQRNKIHQKGARTVAANAATLVTPNAFGTIRVTGTKHRWHQPDVWNRIDDITVVHPITSNQANEPLKLKTDVASKHTEDSDESSKQDKHKTRQTRISQKAQKLIDQNVATKTKKEEEKNQAFLAIHKQKLDSCLSRTACAQSPAELTNRILNLVIGSPRFTNELINMTLLQASFSLPKQQAKALCFVIEIFIKSLQLNYMPQNLKRDSADEQKKIYKELANFLCFVFYFCSTYFKQYLEHIDAKDIIILQKCLIIIGFQDAAQKMYQNWTKKQIELQNKEQEKKKMDTKRTKQGKQTKKTKPLQSKNTDEQTTQSLNCQLDKDFEKILDASCVKPEQVKVHPFCIKRNSETLVQMWFMGHQMERSVQRMEDARVEFFPDYWQRKVLDVIDQRRSALVCAPTGSGKTFIGMYAMQKTLTYNDEVMLVYVCPSKALAQQVNFEIEARFRSKEYSSVSRGSLTSIMLENYSQGNIESAQIVVALPSTLEAILMSPDSREWVDRMAYVIFDEIHSIGDDETQSAYWERLVHLIPCPFLALSATIQNAQSFYSWLSTTKFQGERADARSHQQVEFIQFTERYADLHHYVYSSYNPNTKEQHSLFLPLNPLCCSSYVQFLRNNFSSAVSLPPVDTVQAYYAIANVLTKAYISQPEQLQKLASVEKVEIEIFINYLHPNFYYESGIEITKRRFKYYMACLLNSLQFLLIKNVITKRLFTRILDCLFRIADSTIQKNDILVWEDIDKCLKFQMEDIDSKSDVTESHCEITNTTQSTSIDIDNSAEHASQTNTQLCENSSSILSQVLNSNSSQLDFLDANLLFDFCAQLKQNDFTPALVFHMNTGITKYLFETTVKVLIEKQHYKYYGTPEAEAHTKNLNKKRMDAYRNEMKLRKELEKLKSLSKEQRDEQGITDESLQLLETRPSQPPRDVAEEYDPEFYLGDTYVLGTRFDEIEEIISRCINCQKPVIDATLFVEGLRRGIGVYCEAMPRLFKRSILSLLRMRFLTVVFSNESLSLGINVPCKSTVFLGDHLNLTPLLYRQSSGRAGRRGYDVLGYTIFWNVPMSRLQRLLWAPLPLITGQFPLRPTLVMRILDLVNMYEKQNELLLMEKKQLSKNKYDEIKRILDFKYQRLVRGLTNFCNNSLYSVTAQYDLNDTNNVKLTLSICVAFMYCNKFGKLNGVLDTHGQCTGLASMISWLYQVEPFNYILLYLLQSEVLFNIIQGKMLFESQTPKNKTVKIQSDSNDSNINHGLAILFVYLMHQKPVFYNTVVRMKYMKDYDPLLPPLPDDIHDVISLYNSDLQKMTISYIKDATELFYNSDEISLPISKIRFNRLTSSCPLYKNCVVTQKLQDMVFESYSHSPFSAIVGKAEYDFTAIQEILYSRHSSIPLDSTLLPIFSTATCNINGKHRMLIPSHLLDLYEGVSLSSIYKKFNLTDAELYTDVERMHTNLNLLHLYLSKCVLKKMKHTDTTYKPFEDLFSAVGNLQKFWESLQQVYFK